MGYAQKNPETEEVKDTSVSEETTSHQTISELRVWAMVMVAALGYFVDVFDLWLFASYRVQSLQALGYSATQLTNYGALLINCQQVGLLLGGVVWGVLADKKGRSSVMFASILLYSLGNLANAFVTDIYQYAALRFITGFGLAGEIGAGITLICELLPTKKRGIGTTIVATLGVAGAIGAALAGKHLTWQNGYILGGVMGLSLLVLRVLAHESGMFHSVKERSDVKRGSLKMLISNWSRVKRLLSCVALGVPIYLTFGVFMVFAPEIAEAIGVVGVVTVPDVMFYSAVAMTAGDMFAGMVSQKMQSRKRPLGLFMVITSLVLFAFVFGLPQTAAQFKWLSALVGLFAGYWACLITTAAEQFGTNLRGTVTTMVPNLIRATAIILTTSFVTFNTFMSIQYSLAILVIACTALALWGLSTLQESFHRDLDFLED